METILVGLHVFISIVLIISVLLQAGKGADIGAVFGGTSQAIFGGRGPATFLNKLTIGVSILFFMTSIALTRLGYQRGTDSVIGKVPVTEEGMKREENSKDQIPNTQQEPNSNPQAPNK